MVWLGNNISAGQCRDDRVGVVRVTGFFMGSRIHLFSELFIAKFLVLFYT